jgi:hypothetical protein
MPAVKRIVVLYPDISSYFLSVEKCRTMLKKFFERQQPFLYLIFLENHLEMYNTHIKELEKDNILAAEVKCITDALLVKADNRKLVNSELCMKGSFVELEDAGDASSSSLTPTSVTFMTQKMNTLQNGLIPLTI